MNKKPVIISVLQLRCPQCGKGKLFVHANPFKLKSFGTMNQNCSNCNFSFNPETGFYYGAMFVSYGLAVAFSVLNFLWMFLLWGWTTWRFLIVNAILLLLLMPIIFRLSRSIYLSIIFYIEKSASRKTNKDS